MSERLDTLAGFTALVYAAVFGYGVVTGGYGGSGVLPDPTVRLLGVPSLLAVAYILVRGGGFNE